jgi:FkbM family methyltransferase
MQIDNQQIEFRDGFFWPKKDKIMWDYLHDNDRLSAPSIIADFCKKKETVIQAGGNAGYYPKEYSKHFKNVYTFEPDILNFNCLVLNTLECPNIYRYQSALGNGGDPVVLSENDNCGAYILAGKGHIPILKIDDLNLKNVSLIHLDIEGFEEYALKGAEKTIEKCNPIIVVEVTSQNPIPYIESLGYKKIHQLDVDHVFRRVK